MTMLSLIDSPELMTRFVSCLPEELVDANDTQELGKNAWLFWKLRNDKQFESVETFLENAVEEHCVATFGQSSAGILSELSDQGHGIDEENDLLYDYLSGNFELIYRLFDAFIRSKHEMLTRQPSEFKRFKRFWDF